MDILDIIFEARVNDVATLNKENKTNIAYHSNSSAAYEKIEALLGDFCPNNKIQWENQGYPFVLIRENINVSCNLQK